MTDSHKLTKRQDSLLKFIIQEFVNTAKPVPSALVCKKSRLNVSPATIRNEMNNLETMGYLSQFHTSGGRVPTDMAYRHFVNSLNLEQCVEPSVNDKRAIQTALKGAGYDPRQINKAIADALSKLTANLVIAGTEEQGEPQNFFKFGLSNLMNMPEFHEFDRMFQLTNFFEEFDQMFDAMERQMFGSRPDFHVIRVSIGRENPLVPIKGESVIATRYPLPNGYIGSLTIIGPTRMDYEKNISLVKYTKEELEKKLT
jgi:transcriptional regulator of heat shock response